MQCSPVVTSALLTYGVFMFSRSYMKIPILILVFLSLQACRTNDIPVAGHSEAEQIEIAAAADPDYFEPRVRPGSTLHVMVMAAGNMEVDETEARVNREGRMALPLIGPVDVKSVTLTELNNLLAQRYAEYFVDPQVLISFVDSESDVAPWGYVTVLGRVNNPGRVALPASRDLTVSAAVQQAGGLASSARSSSIRVTRRGNGDKLRNFDVDLGAFARGAIDEDRTLKAGDVVHVPERIW